MAQTENPHRRSLYNKLNGEKYYTGSFDDFNADMDDEETRGLLYGYLREDGKIKSNLTPEKFDSLMLGLEPEAPAPGPNPIKSLVQKGVEKVKGLFTDDDEPQPDKVVNKERMTPISEMPKQQPAPQPQQTQSQEQQTQAQSQPTQTQTPPTQTQTPPTPAQEQPTQQEPLIFPLEERDWRPVWQRVYESEADKNIAKDWMKATKAKEDYDYTNGRMFGDLDKINEAEAEAELARVYRGERYDKDNFENLWRRNIEPIFKEERKKGLESANNAASTQYVGVQTPSSAMTAAFQGAVAHERYTDPSKIMASTESRVVENPAFSDYVFARMGIDPNEKPSGDMQSAPMSEEEKNLFQRLIQLESKEVVDKIQQRMQDTYKAEGAPNSVLEYIAGKAVHDNILNSLINATIRRAAGSSGLREQLRQMAYQEYGKESGWTTRMVGGAAPFAVDLASGGFAIPSLAGKGVLKGGMKIAVNDIEKEAIKRAVASGMSKATAKEAAAGMASRYIATQAPMLDLALRASAGAANFATFETQGEAIRQFGKGEFSPKELLKSAAHGAVLGAVMSGAGGAIQRGTMFSNRATKIGADVAGLGAEVGIFALSDGIRRAMEEGVGIEDIDWAEAIGESAGMVAGMKIAGGVLSPGTLRERYRKSVDYDLKFDKHNLEDIGSLGYDLNKVFPLSQDLGEIVAIRGEGVSPKDRQVTRSGQQPSDRINKDALDKIMESPDVSSDTKRKLYYLATGKVLTEEPVFGAEIRVNEDGSAQIETRNAQGNIIKIRDFNSEEEAQAAYESTYREARLNNIAGITAIAGKLGFGEEIVNSAKQRTLEETGVDMDKVLLTPRNELTKEEDFAISNFLDKLNEEFNQRTGRPTDAEPTNRAEEPWASPTEQIEGAVPPEEPFGPTAPDEPVAPEGGAPITPEEVQSPFDRGRNLPPEQRYSAGKELRQAEADLLAIPNGVVYKSALDLLNDDAEAEAYINGVAPEQHDILRRYYDAVRVLDGSAFEALNKADGEVEAYQNEQAQFAVLNPETGEMTITTAMLDNDKPVYVVSDNGRTAIAYIDGERQQIDSSRLSNQVTTPLSQMVDEYSAQVRGQVMEDQRWSENHHPRTEQPAEGLIIMREGLPYRVMAVTPQGEVQVTQVKYGKDGDIVPANGNMETWTNDEALALQDQYYDELDARNNGEAVVEEGAPAEEPVAPETSAEGPVAPETPVEEPAEERTWLQPGDEEKYAEVKPWLDEHPNATRAQIQREFRLGYNIAGRILDQWTADRENATGAPVEELAVTETPVEEPAPAETPQTEIPRTKAGDIDSKKIQESGNSDLMAQAYLQEFMPQIANEIAQAHLSDAIKAQEKEKSLEAKYGSRQKAVEFWRDVVGKLNTNTAPEEPVEEAPVQQPENILEAGNAAKEKWDGAEKLDGNKASRTLPNGQRVKGRFVMTEAGSATPSHDPFTFKPNEGFPVTESGANVNTNNYETDPNAQASVIAMGSGLDGRMLDDTPWVLGGVVINGNNRDMSSQRAAANGTDTEYNDALLENAEMYGFTEEQVKSMQHPRVYFVPDEGQGLDLSPNTFNLFNAPTKKEQSSVERGVKMGKVLGDRTFNLLSQEVSRFGNLANVFKSPNASNEIVKILQNADEIVEVNQQTLPRYVGTDGLLTEDGQNLVNSALVGYMFRNNPEALGYLESLPKGAIRQMADAMPELVANAKMGEYSLGAELAEAVKALHQQQQSGQSLDDFMKQYDLFADGGTLYGETTRGLVEAMSGRGDGLKSLIEKYNTRAEDASTGQMGMFGNDTRESILRDVLGLPAEEESTADEVPMVNEETPEPYDKTDIFAQAEDIAKKQETKKAKPRKPRKKVKEDADKTDILSEAGRIAEADIEKKADDLQDKGIGVDTSRGDGIMFAVGDVLEGNDREQAIKELMAVTGRSRRTVKKWLDSEESLARVILSGDNAKFLDLQVDESVPSIWKNSDYPQGTVEFSNICRKRLPFTVIYQRLQEEFPNTVFDASTLEDIRATMKENGADVSCGLCFVEDRRQLLGEIGEGFINALKGKADKLSEGQEKALDKLKESGDKYTPNLYELLTLDGMKGLKKSHPAVAQAFIEYNNARGMQAGRLFQAYSAYHRDILGFSPKKVKDINDAGGLRIFSFSDFEAHHLIDLVQVIIDSAAKGIKVQGYTKVPEFAKALKDTGAKINRSLIPKGVGYVDADYTPKDGEAVSPNVIDGKRLLFDTVEGIDVNHPDFFDATDNPNVGNILVGINDEHVRLAMLDPFVDYIIGFHSGQSKALRNKKGLGDWVNYKNIQLDKKRNDKGNLVNADKHGINIYTDVFQKAEELIGHPIHNAKDFQNAFFKECENRKWIPRFWKFIDKNKSGKFVYTPGYDKLLPDFKLFDSKGKLLPQEPVKPIFDDEFNKKILDEYVEGEKSKVPYDDLYEKVKEKLGLSDKNANTDGGIQFAFPEEDGISQGFGSAGTSLNQVPSGMRKVDWKSGTTNVDIGGGRFDTATEFLKEQGVENLVFDPFNRDAKHNEVVANRVREEKADTATCHNVLNVIDTEASRANVILQAAKAIKPEGTAYFTVYEGDKSGVGKQTKSDSWQNNRKTKDYVGEIEKYFDDVKVKNGVIIAKSPKPTDEQSVWDFDGNYDGNGIMFALSPSEDKAYMSAVEGGDMEKAQQMVTDAAAKAMPDTKVVDKDGKPLVVYHGVDLDQVNNGKPFYIFHKNSHFGTQGQAENIIYGTFGLRKDVPNSKVYEAYLNIENPKRVEDQPEDWYKLPEEYWDPIIKQAIAEGYDGIVYDNKWEGHGDSYIAFSPSQIKSADPVTYDDNGNVIPLSERFNEDNEDIRFFFEQPAPVFVSNAKKAVDGIKQDKATPEQWLAMITKNGGLKAGEDKWLGLSDWLKSQDKKTLTKQEVLEYILENQIEVQDVEYADQTLGRYDEHWNYLRTWLEENTDNPDAWYNTITENYGYRDGEGFTLNQGTRMPKQVTDMVDRINNSIDKSNPINTTRLSYTTKGLKNKKEIALVVPTIEPYNEHDEVHFGDAGDGRAVAWIRFGETTTNANNSMAATSIADELESKYGTRYYEKQNQMTDEEVAKYHFANYLERGENADVDFIKGNIKSDVGDERAQKIIPIFEQMVADNEEGNRVLVIDEIQSKRHQEGREKGYAPSDKEIKAKRDEWDKKARERDAFFNELCDKYGVDTITEVEEKATAEEVGKYRRLLKEAKDYEKEYNQLSVMPIARNNLIPDAPFEKNWHELAMKRMLRYAAENGYDKVAWTKGAQQAERYRLGGKVKFIESIKDPYSDRSVYIRMMNNNQIELEVDDNGKVTYTSEERIIPAGSQLTDVIGKGLADKIMASEEPRLKIEGADLDIGGEGMKGFYDQMLPSFMNKYGKKWGVKVEDITLPNVEESGRTMHSVDVTPEMKQSVMDEGQVMFSVVEPIADFDESKLNATDDMEYAKALVEMENTRMAKEVIAPLVESVGKEYKGMSNVVISTGNDFLKKFMDEQPITNTEKSQIQSVIDGDIKPLLGYIGSVDKIIIFDMERAKSEIKPYLCHETAHRGIRQENLKGNVSEWYNLLRGEDPRLFQGVWNFYSKNVTRIPGYLKEECVVHYLQNLITARGIDGAKDRLKEIAKEKGGNADSLVKLLDFIKYGREGKGGPDSPDGSGPKGSGQRRSGLPGSSATGGRNPIRGSSEQEKVSFALKERNEENKRMAQGYKAGTISAKDLIKETLEKTLESNKDNLEKRIQGINALAKDVANIKRRVSALQRAYDKSTVEDLVKLADTYMKAGMFDDPALSEVERLIGYINNAAGKEDITEQAKKVVDIMLDHQLKTYDHLFAKTLKLKGSRTNSSGIKVQGKLDAQGQQILGTLQSLLKLNDEQFNHKVGEIIDGMASPDSHKASVASVDYQAVVLARQFRNGVLRLESEEAALKMDLKNAEEEWKETRKGLSGKDLTNAQKARREYIEETKDAIREIKATCVDQYRQVLSGIAGELADSAERAKAFREEEQKRVDDILHRANSDMQGISASASRQKGLTKFLTNNVLFNTFAAPLPTFEKMMQFFGRAQLRGEGYLFDYFVRPRLFIDDRIFKNRRADFDAMCAKMTELTGNTVKLEDWPDIYDWEGAFKPIKVSWNDGNGMEEHTLTQGQALYIYAANRQTDGRMKLRAMGISEEEVNRVIGEIAPGFLSFADWVIEDFLPKMRERMNAVHEKLFGAPMEYVENYFPLVINKNAIPQEVNLEELTYDERFLSTITGSIKARTRNNYALDIENADFFGVIAEHVRDVETWIESAQWTKDLNTLLSSTRFQNQVKNTASRYGSGDTAWKNFTDVCAIAGGFYIPKTSRASSAYLNISKGVIMSDVAGRLWTALKQLLSSSVYLTTTNPMYLAKSLLTPAASWNWAVRNMPGFQERFFGRAIGNPLLEESDLDWMFMRSRNIKAAGRLGMTPNAFVDALTVSIGAKAAYDTSYSALKSMGFPLDFCRERALSEASLLPNRTQQSSVGQFLAPVQRDRDLFGVGVTTFGNASFGYGREAFEAVAKLTHLIGSPQEFKSRSERTVKKLMREGLSEEQAKKAVSHAWLRILLRNILLAANFGFLSVYTWKLGSGALVSLAFGGGKRETKKQEKKARKAAELGPIEGLAGGRQVSDFINGFFFNDEKWRDPKLYEDFLGDELSSIKRKLTSGRYVEAAYDQANLLARMVFGINPKVVVDAVIAATDYFGDNEKGVHEFLLFAGRVMNAPKSEMERIYLIQMGLNKTDANGNIDWENIDWDDVVSRYAHYRRITDAGYLNNQYEDDEAKAIEEKNAKNFRKKLKEIEKEWSQDSEEAAKKDPDNAYWGDDTDTESDSAYW